MRFGLNDSDINYMISLFKNYPQIDAVIIFGSRAKGNYKPGSDVDIAIKGTGLESVLWQIKDMLEEESPMPYFFDVVNYNSIQNSDLIDHINRVGQIMYSKKTEA